MNFAGAVNESFADKGNSTCTAAVHVKIQLQSCSAFAWWDHLS